MPNQQVVECQILSLVKTAAAAMAEKQMQELYHVARRILVKASEVAEPTEDGVAHPAQRPASAERERIKFRMPKDEHVIVKARIRASGRSMTSVLEEGLERYARTGKI